MDPIKLMLDQYDLSTDEGYNLAFREIMQQIALVGLWRGGFFNHAAFYGGTACRIFYGLNRYSEDLDFSLLSSDPTFTIKNYLPYIIKELESYEITASFQEKEKQLLTLPL